MDLYFVVSLFTLHERFSTAFRIKFNLLTAACKGSSAHLSSFVSSLQTRGWSSSHCKVLTEPQLFLLFLAWMLPHKLFSLSRTLVFSSYLLSQLILSSLSPGSLPRLGWVGLLVHPPNSTSFRPQWDSPQCSGMAGLCDSPPLHTLTSLKMKSFLLSLALSILLAYGRH